MRLPPQIWRLVILTLAIVACYGLAKSVLTPASFGEYGHYRGAALEEMASRDPTFSQAKACDECHAETAELLAKYEHRKISCEACHGPGRAHARNPDLATRPLGNNDCNRCHVVEPARPTWVRQIKVSHFEGDRCVECHLGHRPKEEPPAAPPKKDPPP